MRLRRIRFLTAISAVALIAGLDGCAPTPQPEPTPTALLSNEREAFAAAEKTYRDYIAENNARRNGDDDAAAEQYLTGPALEAYRQLRAEEANRSSRVVGEFTVTSFTPIHTDFGDSLITVDAVVCIDATSARVEDAHGNDVTPSDSPRHFTQALTFTQDEDGLLISEERAEKPTCE